MFVWGQWSATHPSQGRQVPVSQNFVGPPTYTHTDDTQQVSNQILYNDKPRQKEKFYMVDHDPGCG